jgi:hypothetical protein
VVAHMRWWWWWGCALAKRKAGKGVWAKRLKPSRHGSILGALCKTAKGDVAWGWHGPGGGGGGGGVVRLRNTRRGGGFG